MMLIAIREVWERDCFVVLQLAPLAQDSSQNTIFNNDSNSIGARGWLRLKITTKGKSAHTGSRRQKGINAIHQIADIITAIKKLNLGNKKEPYFDYDSNFNISLIKGGIAINIVPDECEAKVDIRFLPSQTPQEILSKIKNEIKKLKQKNPKLSCQIEVLQSENPFLTDPKKEFVKLLQKNAQKELKREISLVASGAGSAGNVISKLGIPIINAFGCRSDNVHAPNEWIDIDTLPKIFEIYKKTILGFCEK